MDRWSSVGELRAARTHAGAAVMADGRILTFGGEDAFGPLASAEASSLRGGSQQLSPMHFARSKFATATLDDGRILVAGGRAGQSDALNTAEIYDPTTDTWTMTSPMAVPRAGATASVITVGNKRMVLIAGGELSGDATSALELFDPELNSFILATAGMSSPRKGHAAAVLSDGRVLLAGGSTGDAILDTVELYDPSTGLANLAGHMAVPRTGLTATALDDGRILLAGGNNRSGDLSSAEIFDPSDQSFASLRMTVARSGHQAFLLPDNNTVMIVGGLSKGRVVSNTETFVPWKNHFRSLSSLQQARSGFAGGVLKGKGVVVSGGTGGSGALQSREGIAFATLVTDKHSYLAGDQVTLSGAGWKAGETVRITIPGESEAEFTADLNGEFSVMAYSPTARDIGKSILVQAAGSSDAGIRFTVDTTGAEESDAGAVAHSRAAANLAPLGTAAISTDQNKYSVSQPMVISGTGFSPNAPISVTVLKPDHSTDTLNTVSSGSGTFSVTYTAVNLPGRYKITATDGLNSANTAATEADAIKTDFFQCANKNPTLGLCDWISSILQSSDSRIFEGMSTLQRLTFDQIPPTGSNVHVLKFHIDATKAGSHAYDFITTWDAALLATNAIDAVHPANSLYPILDRTPAGVANACNNPSNPQAALQAVCTALRAAANPNFTHAVMSNSFTNSDVTGNIQTAFTNYQSHFSGGNTQVVTLFGNSSFTGTPTLSFDGYDKTTGDQQGMYTLTWTSASTQMEIEFGAHVAQGLDTLGFNIGYGAGLGAANISGGPYHVSIDSFDSASLGAQDNQLKGSDILIPPSTPTLGSTLTGAVLNGKVEVGTSVHDTADINTNSALNLIPAGSTVTFQLFANLTCSAPAIATYGPLAVPSGGQTAHVDSPSFTPTGGDYSYQVTFTSGNTAIVQSGVAPCEPFTVIAPATTLTLKSAPTKVHTGDTVTIVVTEANTGNDPLTAVNVTGGGKCVSFTGGATTLAVGASTDFTCTFTATSGANAWSADGHGLDSLNNAVPATGEHVEGSVPAVSPATTLTLKSAPTKVHTGDSVTIVVTETNTGNDPLTSVNVTGGGKCATFTGGATTLAVGASTDFTCTFTATSGANAWSADGHGLDSLNAPVPATGEHVEGSVPAISPATTLTLKSAPTKVHTGDSVTIVVTEANTGNDPLTSVNVTGGGKCATFTGGATTLAVGASTDFTCTFTATSGANAWSADGHGLDSLNNAVPATGEHVEGSVPTISPATTLTLKSAPTKVHTGDTVTIVVTEANTGNDPLTAVNVTGGGKCATFTGGATTLAVGASTDFTCTFTATSGANAWSADGHGLDSLNAPVPATGEHVEGSVPAISPATTLTLKSAPTSVHTGDSVTIVVTEANTGNDPLTAVNVTGGGKCATFTGGATTLAVGASTDFTCTFTATSGANAWSADGHGLDSLNAAVPATGEHVEGTINSLAPATTLTLKSQTPPGASVEAGTSVTIVVTEANTGNDPLHAVNVTGGGKCATFTGGATTLAVGASTDFTCTFTATSGANAWSADGHGLDSLNAAVPSTGEHAEGTVNGLAPATTLTLKSQTPPGASVEAGTLVTIVVTEANTGNDPLHAVNVTGGGKCATFTGGATTLAVGASTDFTCTFTATSGANAWFADGHGLDSLGNLVPAAGEHASGSVNGLVSSTALTTKSVSPGSPVEVGTLVTVVVTESNTGNNALTNVSVTGGGVCATFTGGATTLAVGGSTDFTCTFVAALGTNSWFADGHGTDSLGNPVPATGEHTSGSVTGLTSYIVVNKFSKGGTATFNFDATNFTVNPITTAPDGSGNGTGTTGPIQVHTGSYSVGESAPPTGWKLDASTCTVDGVNPFGTPTVVGGVNVSWTFTIPLGVTVTCTFDNSLVAATTRTQGFWATHTGLSNTVWNTLVPDADKTLCSVPITAIDTPDGQNQLMGGFWANISQLSAKGKRKDLDQVRMQMLQQYLAAVLNVYEFGSGSEALLQTARTAYCGTNQSAIQAQIGVLGTFNSSGDSGLFTPGVSATPQESKKEANIAFWDVTTH